MLLLLAGVSIATLTGENGILREASYAKFSNKISAYKEQIDLYCAEEKIKNQDFNIDELIATNTGTITISDIIPEIGEDKKVYQIIKGKLIYVGSNKNEIENCLKLGIKVSNIVLDENNTILRN